MADPPPCIGADGDEERERRRAPTGHANGHADGHGDGDSLPRRDLPHAHTHTQGVDKDADAGAHRHTGAV